MCLIIHKTFDTKDSTFKITHQHILESGLGGNNDGIGIMYIKDGRVKCEKKYFGKSSKYTNITDNKSASLQAKWFKQYQDLDSYVVHLRYTTHGLSNVDMCHPFRILTKGERLYDGSLCAYDLCMMHNGMLDVKERIATNSDTWHFAKDYLRPILLSNPELLHNPQFQHILEEFCGGYSKLIFLDSTGRITYINKDLGKEHEGYWFSNTELSSVFPSTRMGYVARMYGEHGWEEEYKPASSIPEGELVGSRGYFSFGRVSKSDIQDELLHCDETYLECEVCPECGKVDCLSLFEGYHAPNQNYLVCDSCTYAEKMDDNRTQALLEFYDSLDDSIDDIGKVA